MATTANIIPTSPTDGISYASAVPLTTNEAALGDALKTPDPISVIEGQSIVAVVQLSINGIITGSNAYVVMQTSIAGVWVDIAWCVWTGNQGIATFVLTAGGLGQENNSFQQSRNTGSFPASNGSNVCPLGGQVRFVGRATAVGGSSSVAGTTAGITVTISYKLTNPR